MSGSSFAKRERDLAKKAKADAKRERRRAAQEAAVAAGATGPARLEDGPSTADLLRRIEEVHRLHEDGRISDDDFQDTKAELLAQLSID